MSQDGILQIVDGGYCIGCGACAVVSEAIDIKMQDDGQYRAEIDTETGIQSTMDIALSVCPFSDEEPNEDELGRSLYEDGCQLDRRIGWYRDLYAGHIAAGTFRERGASGGVITWLLTQLLEKGMVDAIIHVHKSDPKETGVLFKYGISRTAEEVSAGAKSRYYPIEISQVMAEVRRTPGRYVFVGLPCFVKSVRRLAEQDTIIKERIVYTVGLVCGHLKSKAFADCFAWQVGIPPGQLEKIDFRVKILDRVASDYGVLLRSADVGVVKPTRELFGSNWGHNFFRYSACDYCDDVFAETADIAVGDAWLPGYSSESGGNCVVVVRSAELRGLFDEAKSDGRACLDSISADLMAESQAGGLRDRREGLAYRLSLKDSDEEWAPKKRVMASDAGIGSKRKNIYLLRKTMRQRSHELWLESVKGNDFSVFRDGMQKLICKHNRLYTSLFHRIARKVKRVITKITG